MYGKPAIDNECNTKDIIDKVDDISRMHLFRR